MGLVFPLQVLNPMSVRPGKAELVEGQSGRFRGFPPQQETCFWGLCLLNAAVWSPSQSHSLEGAAATLLISRSFLSADLLNLKFCSSELPGAPLEVQTY